MRARRLGAGHVFGSLDWERLFVLAVLGLIILGPERLPGLARDLGRALRALRVAMEGAREQLNAELGPEFADLDLRALNPAAFIRGQLLDDDSSNEPAEAGGLQPPSAPAPAWPRGEAAPYDPDAT